MTSFDHERLDVYQAAIDFVATANTVVESLPRGRSYLADQLNRAAISIPLNVAEGAGGIQQEGEGALLPHGFTVCCRVRCDPRRL
jgi:hypothetical protein